MIGASACDIIGAQQVPVDAESGSNPTGPMGVASR